MITLDVTTDNQSGIAGMISGLNAQLPFAMATAINDTVNEVQTAVQTSLHSDFHLRQASFIANTIYRKPGQDFATKTNLSASVRINPDRDFLAKFEDGGEKVASGAEGLAVPIFRIADKNIIVKRGDPLDPRMLLASIAAASGKGSYKSFSVKDAKRKGVKGVLIRRTPLPDEQRVFLITNAQGSFIVQRIGQGRSGSFNTKVLYAFKKETPLPESLHFDEIGQAIADSRFQPNWERALEYAIETMK